ncbi:peptide chain release factor 1 [Nitrosopumilus sp. b1]|uniref:peptide chain release factor aRF-1 n=1 Tax=Nitrosopumilus sp. b1 TaxID=2109907 RepID=UPI0015F6286C|nr:peptide chain release factor aRF-1 [Nitrosopumilus sp. b1]KAF6242679.1 peptide chain release factor 1 [Nitrosopumilus sp. b1]
MGKIQVDKQDSVKLYKIRKTLEELSNKSGHGTELISVYIPAGKQLHEIISVLKEEQGTAVNIKSDLTRGHVVDSLGKVIQRLRLYNKTPDRGLVMFCGALPPEGGGPIGSEVVKVYEIDPPKELKTFLYRCDDHFHVDILKDMLKDDNLIGFLAIDSKDAGWGLLHGDKIEVLSETGSGVAGKHRQGGQSAKRFQKLREMELTYYFNRVAETTREYFVDIYQVKGLIVSGPGPTKEDFVNGGYLEYRLQENIIATLDTSYSGSEGIREAFAKASDVLSDFRMVEEKQIVEKLFQKINSHSGLGTYGLGEVIDLLKNNVVDTLLITDDTNLIKLDVVCNRCKHLQEQIVERPQVIPKRTELLSAPCPGCKAADLTANEQDIVDYLSLIAAKTGAKIEVISGSAEHGAMLASLGKVGAILRYNPGHAK